MEVQLLLGNTLKCPFRPPLATLALGMTPFVNERNHTKAAVKQIECEGL
jgi:hypothetical protein